MKTNNLHHAVALQIVTNKLTQQASYFKTTLLILFLIICSFKVHAKYKQPTSTLTNYNKIYSRICKQTNNGLEIIDANVVVFDNAFSNAVDGDDAVKMNNSGENLAVKRDNRLLVVEGRQSIIDKDTIYLEMWNILSQQYSLEIDATLMDVTDVTATLVDKYLGTNTPVNIGLTNFINFTCDANAASKARDRFKIVFKKLISLPVRFLQVDATVVNNIPQITWLVAQQLQVKNYVVEKSIDGNTFIGIQTIAAKLQPTLSILYTISDALATSNNCFYRIKSIDNDGKITTSQVVFIAINKVKQSVVVYPNPVVNKTIFVKMMAMEQGDYTAVVNNVQGQIISKSTFIHQKNNVQHTISVSPNTTAGIYYLQIIDSKGNKNSIQINIL
jgi:Secretion system C-terminal sorting domain